MGTELKMCGKQDSINVKNGELYKLTCNNGSEHRLFVIDTSTPDHGEAIVVDPNGGCTINGMMVTEGRPYTGTTFARWGIESITVYSASEDERSKE